MAGNPGWKKGTSGNPGGRRKQDYRLKDLAQEYTEEALLTLVAIMRSSEDDKARAVAADKVLDRGYGKPAQSVDLTNSDGSMSQAWLAAMKSVDGGVEEAPDEAHIAH